MYSTNAYPFDLPVSLSNIISNFTTGPMDFAMSDTSSISKQFDSSKRLWISHRTYPLSALQSGQTEWNLCRSLYSEVSQPCFFTFFYASYLHVVASSSHQLSKALFCSYCWCPGVTRLFVKPAPKQAKEREKNTHIENTGCWAKNVNIKKSVVFSVSTLDGSVVVEITK